MSSLSASAAVSAAASAMTAATAATAATSEADAPAVPVALPNVRAALLLVSTAVVALALYYFIGVDQGVTSVFGNDMHVHEFVHDARHFLGFPCH
jgi:hypothetical protein